jgi:hypothetical protein
MEELDPRTDARTSKAGAFRRPHRWRKPPPAELLDNYDITEGHLWLLVLLWIGVGPAATRKIAAR